MDINQSSLSQYKSNKAGISRSAAETKALSAASKASDTSSSAAQNTKQQEFKEGQLLKGQVTDLRYNEVKIKLEPGEQVITARLSGDVPLEIGQEAQFLVTDASSERLVIKYIPKETAPTDATIQKALTASGLPLTDRNRALVSELLDHRMPIDKQTLQTLVKQAVLNRQASPLTLVLMYKNNIPMTPANIKQFEAYQNGTHQLINDIRSITQNISGLLNNTDANSLNLKEAVSVNGKLIDILYPEAESSVQAEGSAQSDSSVQDKSSVQAKSSVQTESEIQLINIFSEEELKVPGQAAQKLAASPALPAVSLSDVAKQLSNGALSLEEAVAFLTGRNQDDTDPSNHKALQGILRQLQAEAGNEATVPVLSKLLNQYTSLQDTSPELSEVLSPARRTELLQNLADLPDNGNQKERIELGTDSLKETLTFIQNNLDKLSEEHIGKLLQAPVYTKLLEDAFLKKWTLKPEDIADKDSVVHLYRQMKEDLDKISNLSASAKTAAEINGLQAPLKNMQENLQFMKELNNVFTYLQLPIQFENQEAHTDLYVLANKKALNDKRETLSVLLHLEMKNLGSLNVHIQQNHSKQLKAVFYIEDSDTGRLISHNLPLLSEALQKKGYNIRAEVKDTYQKPDFVHDFIEQSSQDSLVKRFSFDIRT